MAFPLVALRRPHRPAPTRRPPLANANVLVVDRDAATGILLRDRLEQDYGANVEVATHYDEALDVLGNTARPTTLVMLDPALPSLDGDALMALLRQHKARIHVTLHGHTPPESLGFPENYVGVAAYTHLATSAIACATAETVVAQGLTVRDIVDKRRVPATLDWKSAVAIYTAEPGQPFPLTVRT
ncbi:MAG: response regulator [Hyphomicrobiaceae bacterium]